MIHVEVYRSSGDIHHSLCSGKREKSKTDTSEDSNEPGEKNRRHQFPIISFIEQQLLCLFSVSQPPPPRTASVYFSKH
jgi:hypothetical protein